MSIATPALTNFTAGELSPRLAGRVDLSKYYNGCDTLLNFIVHPHGGATRRSGFRFVSAALCPDGNQEKPSLLVPFEYNAEQSYVLEFGEDEQGQGCMRVFMDRGRVVVPQPEEDPPGEGAGESASGEKAPDSGPGTAAEEGGGNDSPGENPEAENPGGNDSGEDAPPDKTESTGEPGEEVRLVTPYKAQDLERLGYVQSNDTLILTHPRHAPRKLTCTDHHSWTLEELRFVGQPEQWKEDNWPAVACFFEQRLVMAATPAQPNTLWFSRTGEYFDFRTNTREVPLEDWDDMEVKSSGEDPRDGRAGQSFTVLDGGRFEKQSVVRGQSPDKEKRFFRYKGEVEFLPSGADQKVLFAETPGSGEVELVHDAEGALNGDFWESLSVGDRIENPEAGEPLADDGLEITLSAAQANAIEFLVPKSRLWVGTSGGEWTVGGATAGEALSPENVKAGQEGTCGASGARPESVATASLFIQRAGRKVREMQYRFDSDAYGSRDLTILSEHITAPGLLQLAYAQEPDSLVWCLRRDGRLLSLTYKPEQEVLAWARHETSGQVERICTVYNRETLTDELWIVVCRNVNGHRKRFVEYLECTFEGGETADGFFLDSGVSYAGTPLQRLAGLEHLAGERVSVVADGLVYRDREVDAAGGLDLPQPAHQVHVGLEYESVLRPMHCEGGSGRGTAQTKQRRIVQVSVRFHNTLGGGIGPDAANLEPVQYLTSAANQGRALPLWSGDKTVKFARGWSRDGRLTVVQSQPLPMSVLLIVPEIVVNT